MPQLHLVARYIVRVGCEAEVIRLLRQLADASRSEAGNLSFDVFANVDDPRRIVLLEQYADVDALSTHRQTPYFHDLVLGQIVPLLESRVLDTYEREEP